MINKKSDNLKVVSFSSYDEDKLNKQLLLNLKANVFDHSSEGIFITNVEKKIIEVNEAFMNITGYKQEDIVGKFPLFMTSEIHDESFIKKVWHTVDSKNSWIGEIWDKKRNGDVYPRMLSLSVIRDAKGLVTNYIGFFSDVSLLKRSQEFSQYVSYYDSLTGLPNRVLFKDRLEQATLQAQRNNWKVALIVLDMDNFKRINDIYNYSFGDIVLVETAERLKDCIFERDTVARFAGDEFGIILNDITNIEQVANVANKVLEKLEAPYFSEKEKWHLSASLGVAIYPDDGLNESDLLRHADIAMSLAKDNGKNQYQFFSEEMNTHAVKMMVLENNIRRALEDDQFTVYYQPQIDIRTGEIAGVEALARWNHPDRGLVSPAEFIPIAEETGLIIPLGLKILKEAVNQNKKWQDAGYPPFRIAVNVSSVQFKDKNLLNDIKDVLVNSGLDPKWLEIELTESVLADDVIDSSAILNAIKDMGIALAIDDFGSGYSNFAYLKKYKIDKIKIDQSFIKDLNNSSEDEAITRAIITMSKGLHVNVLAEGVENKKQLDQLFDEGCQEIQGFFYSRPVPAEIIEKYLQDEKIFDSVNEYFCLMD